VTNPAIFRERVLRAVTPLIQATPYYLEDVSVRPAGRRLLVQIVVDSDNGLDLDSVAAISRELDHIIEVEDLLDGSGFTLEVTSPGIDRPLTLPRHWRANVTRKILVTLNSGETFTDRLQRVNETELEFEVRGHIALAEVADGVVQIEFNRPAATGNSDRVEDVDTDEVSE
jgi:ribosome maturation factor RimP